MQIGSQQYPIRLDVCLRTPIRHDMCRLKYFLHLTATHGTSVIICIKKGSAKLCLASPFNNLRNYVSALVSDDIGFKNLARFQKHVNLTGRIDEAAVRQLAAHFLHYGDKCPRHIADCLSAAPSSWFVG